MRRLADSYEWTYRQSPAFVGKIHPANKHNESILDQGKNGKETAPEGQTVS